jgi:hypothetical protein
MVFSAAGFPWVFPEKRLEQKSLKGQTKAEEEGPRTENGGTEDAPRGDGPSLKKKKKKDFGFPIFRLFTD